MGNGEDHVRNKGTCGKRGGTCGKQGGTGGNEGNRWGTKGKRWETDGDGVVWAESSSKLIRWWEGQEAMDGAVCLESDGRKLHYMDRLSKALPREGFACCRLFSMGTNSALPPPLVLSM